MLKKKNTFTRTYARTHSLRLANMDFLTQQRHGDSVAPDDVEAQGASHSNGASYPTEQAGGEAGAGQSTGLSPEAAAAAGGNNSRQSGAGQSGEHIRFGEYRLKEPPKSSDLNEYDALDRFITNFDQERRASLASAMGSGKRKLPKWWQFWKSSEGEGVEGQQPTDIGKPPDSWLDTDIHTGITTAQVEERRRRFGYNELTAEKENMFAKILGYFQGPILYGEQAFSLFPPPADARYSCWQLPRYSGLIPNNCGS